MRVVAILQARLGSTRLPNKVLLPLAGKPMVQNIIERVQRATTLDAVVLAVPKEPDSHLLEAIADTTKCIYARFDHIPAADLVSRYLGAAQAYAADIIVRIPCDNPCVDPEYIDRTIEDYLEYPYTFLSNTTDCVTGNGQWVDGVGAEVFSVSTMKWLDRKTQNNKEWREHPHRYFYDLRDNEWDESFGVEIHRPYGRPVLHLDVNTKADYEFIRDIYQHFGHNRFTTDEVLAYLERKKVPA